MSIATGISTKPCCASCGRELGLRHHRSPRGNLRCGPCHRERCRILREQCHRARFRYHCVRAAKGLLLAAGVAPCVYLLLEIMAQASR